MLKRRIRITRQTATFLVGLACLIIGTTNADARWMCAKGRSTAPAKGPLHWVLGVNDLEQSCRIWSVDRCGSDKFQRITYIGQGDPHCVTGCGTAFCQAVPQCRPDQELVFPDGRCRCPDGTREPANRRGSCLPYGPDNCPSGYQWEEGPKMCVQKSCPVLHDCREAYNARKKANDDQFVSEMCCLGAPHIQRGQVLENMAARHTRDNYRKRRNKRRFAECVQSAQCGIREP